MVIKTLNINGYGKLRGVSINFDEGLNVIFGANESGKSTVIRCLISLLYGQNAEEKDSMSEKELMRPWDGVDYSAEIKYSLKNGKVYRVWRDFENNIVKIFDEESGNEITDDFEKDATGEPQFAIKHFGLSKSAFLSSVLVRQDEMSALEDASDLIARISAIARTSTEEKAFLEAKEKLQKALAEIGEENDPESPLGKVTRNLTLAEETKRKYEENSQILQTLVSERASLLAHLKELQDEVDKYAFLLKRDELKKCEDIINQLEEIDKKIPLLQEKIDKIAGKEEVTIEGRTTLYSLQADLKTLRTKLQEYENKKQDMAKAYDEIKKQFENKRKFLELDQQKLDILKKGETLDETRLAIQESKRKMLEDSLKKMEEIKIKFREEEQKFVGFNSAEEFDEKVSELESKIAKKDILKIREEEGVRLAKELEGLKTRIRERFLTAIFMICAGGAMILLSYQNNIFTGNYEAGPADLKLLALGIATIIFGFIWWLGTKSIRRETNITRQNQAVKMEEMKQIKEEMASAQIALKELFSRVGALSIEELRKKYREYSRIVIDMETTMNLIKTLEKEIDSPDGEIDDQGEMKKILVDIGLIRPDENVNKEVLLRFKNEYAEAEKLRDKEEKMRTEYETFLDEMGKIRQNIANLEEKINEILAMGEVESAEEYEEAFKISQELDIDRRTLESLIDKRRILAGNRTLDEYKERVRTLKESTDALIAANPSLKDLESSDIYPEKIREILDNLQPQLMETKSKISVVEMKMKPLEEMVANMTKEMSEENLRIEKERLLMHKKALEIAIDTVKALSKEYEEHIFAPSLAANVSDIINKITQKYNLVEIDENLNIKIKTSGEPGEIGIDKLSHGTISQLYFALRLGIIRFLTTDLVSLPLIMDDPFLDFDDIRRKNVFSVLAEIEAERQILLLTCSAGQRVELEEIMKNKKVIDVSEIGEMELIRGKAQ